MQGSRPALVAAGEPIADGVELQEVHADHVIVLRQGMPERIELGTPVALIAPAGVRARPGAQVMRRASLALLVAAMLFAGTARSQDEPVTLNFVNADIEAVAAAVGKMTNRNFIIDPRVKGTINIVSARPVPSSAVYGIFLSALRLQGFTAVESGGVTKILPEADAKLHGGAVGSRGAASGDQLQTQVYTLKYTSAAQLMPVLRPIISPNNTIAAFVGNNSLVITDYGDNLRRIERIIEAIDRPGGGGEPVVIPLRFAAVADVMQTLNRVLPDSVAGARGSGGGDRCFGAPVRGAGPAHEQHRGSLRESGARRAGASPRAPARRADRHRRQRARHLPEKRRSDARGANAARHSLRGGGAGGHERAAGRPAGRRRPPGRSFGRAAARSPLSRRGAAWCRRTRRRTRSSSRRPTRCSRTSGRSSTSSTCAARRSTSKR